MSLLYAFLGVGAPSLDPVGLTAREAPLGTKNC